MASISAMSKAAMKSGFIDFMRSAGFEQGYALGFYRKNKEGVYAIVKIETYAGGGRARLLATATVDELMDESDREKFPICVGVLCGGDLGRLGVGSSDTFSTKTEDELLDFYREAMWLVKHIAMPYFDSIRDRNGLWDALHDDVKTHPAVLAVKGKVVGS